MITIKKLIGDANTALCKCFTKIVNGVKIEPKVYEHTTDMFLDEEDQGIAVWCEIPTGAIEFFSGTVNFIITADEKLVCVNAFLGDECIDKAAADKLCCGDIDLGSWVIEDNDDYLMLVTDLSASVNLEEELSRRFGEFLDDGFAEEIKEILACFK